MENPIPKLNIEKDAQDLKVFMFTIQGGPVAVTFPEDFQAVLAYNDVDAVNMVRKNYPQGVVINYRKRATVPVKKIVDAINLQPNTAQDLKVTVTPPTPREKTAHDFIYGLMMIADKFVVDKRDQASLKRIIKKIKLNHEDQTITESKENIA